MEVGGRRQPQSAESGDQEGVAGRLETHQTSWRGGVLESAVRGDLHPLMFVAATSTRPTQHCRRAGEATNLDAFWWLRLSLYSPCLHHVLSCFSGRR